MNSNSKSNGKEDRQNRRNLFGNQRGYREVSTEEQSSPQKQFQNDNSDFQKNIENTNQFQKIKSPQKQINATTQNMSNEYFSHNFIQNQLEPRFNYTNNFDIPSTLINEQPTQNLQDNMIWQSFLDRIFMITHKGSSLHTLDDCRHYLEEIFEDKVNFNRDFLDYLLLKKNRNYEEINNNEIGLVSKRPNRQTQIPSKPSQIDDQDMMPMDIDSDQNELILPRFHRNSDEEEKKQSEESYLKRCKKVGRIGAKQACLDLTSKFGEVLQSSRDDLDIEAISQFVSIRANVGVFSGCYYYEVMLKTMGLMQIGWSTIQTPFTSHRGVGDDPTSFAYDGFRVKKWNKDNLAYGEAWSIGDVIGTLIDFQKRQISFWRNHKPLGPAFQDIPVGQNVVYFPAISFQKAQRVVFNFGKSSLAVQANKSYGMIEEPMANVLNTRQVCFTIIEFMKRYLESFHEFDRINLDQRLCVGSLLVEYLFPLILDDYLMADEFLKFLFEVIIIKKNEYKELLFELFEIHFSNEQIQVFISQLTRLLVKKIANLEIVMIVSKKPKKQEFDMTYFQLLLELMEKPTFLCAWINSDTFFNDLEILYEMHLPSSSDWDTFLTPNYHDYLPGSDDNQKRYLKNYQKTQEALVLTQAYWLKLTSLLLSKSNRNFMPQFDIQRAPSDCFKDFLHHMACKSIKNGQVNEQHAGLNNSCMLTNLFTCSAYFLDQLLLSKPVECFPYQGLFMRDSYDFDNYLMKMDRIGGSFTHLENELSDHLKPFRGLRMNDEEKETFRYAKDLLFISINGILPEIEKYTLSLDQLYLNHRKLLDLTSQGKIEKSSEITNEMLKIIRTKLPHWRLFLQNKLTRTTLIKFSTWLLQLMNFIDQSSSDLIYIMPDYLISIPFELLRMLKRESQLIVPTGLPICQNIIGPGQDQRQSLTSIGIGPYQGRAMGNFSGQIISGVEQTFNELPRTNEEIQLEQTFFQEMVSFVARHFIDDRIANPDLKDSYLVRLNVLLQHNQFIQLLERDLFAQEKFVLMLMKSFTKDINLRHVTKNILRLAKGNGFKEIVYEENIEKTISRYYLYKLRTQLMALQDKTTQEFLNSFFNYLNENTTNFFITLKELKDDHSQQTLYRTNLYFQTVVDLLRMCELFSTWCAEIFINLDHVHGSRLINYINSSLNSIFIGGVDNFINIFADKIYSNSVSLERFLAPLIGILSSLYRGIEQYSGQNQQQLDSIIPQRYESLESLYTRINSFNDQGIQLMQRLIDIIKEKLMDQNKTSNEMKLVFDYEQMLQKLKQIQQNKHESKIQETSGKEEFSEEKTCQICCFMEQDTEFIPCQHRTCKTCVQTHMLNSEKCPFCNAEIKHLKAL